MCRARINNDEGTSSSHILCASLLANGIQPKTLIPANKRQQQLTEVPDLRGIFPQRFPSVYLLQCLFVCVRFPCRTKLQQQLTEVPDLRGIFPQRFPCVYLLQCLFVCVRFPCRTKLQQQLTKVPDLRGIFPQRFPCGYLFQCLFVSVFLAEPNCKNSSQKFQIYVVFFPNAFLVVTCFSVCLCPFFLPNQTATTAHKSSRFTWYGGYHVNLELLPPPPSLNAFLVVICFSLCVCPPR